RGDLARVQPLDARDPESRHLLHVGDAIVVDGESADVPGADQQDVSGLVTHPLRTLRRFERGGPAHVPWRPPLPPPRPPPLPARAPGTRRGAPPGGRGPPPSCRSRFARRQPT